MELNPIGETALDVCLPCLSHGWHHCICPCKFGPKRPEGKFSAGELKRMGYRYIYYTPETGEPCAVDGIYPGDFTSLALRNVPDYEIIECDRA
jgi:hypothetical protein